MHQLRREASVVQRDNSIRDVGGSKQNNIQNSNHDSRRRTKVRKDITQSDAPFGEGETAAQKEVRIDKKKKDSRETVFADLHCVRRDHKL